MKAKDFLIIGIMILLIGSIFLFLNIPQETITITELLPIKLPAIVIP